MENVDTSTLTSTPVIAYVASDTGVMPLADDGDLYGAYANYSYGDTVAAYYDYSYYDYSYGNTVAAYTETYYSEYVETYYSEYYDYSNYFNTVTLSSSPSAQTVNEGSTATFTISVTTGSSVTTKTYQWYYSTTSSGTGTAISGATSASYSVTGSLSNTGRYYYCICKTNGATTTVTSSRALLTVKAYRAYDVYVAPGHQMYIPTASNNSTNTITACTISDTSLATAASDGLVTGVATGTTTATITIGGVSKTVNVYVIEKPLEALFYTLANVMRVRQGISITYYPNQLANVLLSNSVVSASYETMTAMLQDIATNIKSLTSTTTTLYPYQFAQYIAKTITPS